MKMKIVMRFLLRLAAFIMLFCLMLAAVPVSVHAGYAAPMATTDFPLKDEISISGADWLMVDKTYDADDFLITRSGDTSIVNLLVYGLEFPRDDMQIDLGESSFYSSSSIEYIEDSVFGNGTYNAGSVTEENSTESNPTINNELQSQYAGSQLYAKATFGDNDSAYQYVDWKSDFYYDYNGDGDFADALDEDFNPKIGLETQVLYFCGKADFANTTDTTANVNMTFSFETSVTANYDVSVVFYPGSGDTTWSNIDGVGENKATWSLYDTDATFIAGMIPITELLQEDSGDGPTLEGLDYITVRMYSTAGQALEFWARNFCWWTKKMAATDNVDNDGNWDMNVNGVPDPDELWDDHDFLCTKITEGATESYDSTVPLITDVRNGTALLVPAKVINFEGVGKVDIATNAELSTPAGQPTISSVLNSTKAAYLTTVSFALDSLRIDKLDNPTTYLSWTDWDHNMTLKESVLASGNFADFYKDLMSYTFEYQDYYSNVESSWKAVTGDNEEVQFDQTNPDTSLGNLQHFTYSFWTTADHSGTVQATSEAATAATAPSGGTGGGFQMDAVGTIALVILIIAGTLGMIGLIGFLRSRGKRQRRR